MIRDEVMARKGDTLYQCTGHDYGGASMDEELTGVKHLSLTHDPDGGYPFFTVPEPDAELIPG